jgi:hypothetical protein
MKSFEGLICDTSLAFFPLAQEEIAELFCKGKKEIKDEQAPSTSKELFERSQQEMLRASYSKKKRRISSF